MSDTALALPYIALALGALLWFLDRARLVEHIDDLHRWRDDGYENLLVATNLARELARDLGCEEHDDPDADLFTHLECARQLVASPPDDEAP